MLADFWLYAIVLFRSVGAELCSARFYACGRLTFFVLTLAIVCHFFNILCSLRRGVALLRTILCLRTFSIFAIFFACSARFNACKFIFIYLFVISRHLQVFFCKQKNQNFRESGTSRTLNRSGQAPRPHASNNFQFCIIYRKQTRQG